MGEQSLMWKWIEDLPGYSWVGSVVERMKGKRDRKQKKKELGVQSLGVAASEMDGAVGLWALTDSLGTGELSRKARTTENEMSLRTIS